MTRHRKIFLPLGALLAVIALAAAVMIVRASADELLQQAARLMADAREGHAFVDFTFETPDKSGSGKIEVWGKKDAGPNGEPAFRINVLESSKADAQGTEIVSDGSQAWFYHKTENTVYVGTLEELKAKMREHAQSHDFAGVHEFDHDPAAYSEEDMPQTPEEFVDKMLEYVTAEREGTAMIGSDNTNQILLIPNPETMPDEFLAAGGLFRVFLRISDNALLAAEYSDGALGSASITATDVHLKVNEDDESVVTDSDFVFVIEDGMTVVNIADWEPPAPTPEETAQIEAMEVLTPTRLPAAARLDETLELRGAVVQRYRLPDGGDFTIAQGAANAARPPKNSKGEPITVRGVEGMIYSDESGTRTLLTWSEDDKKIWIGGDVTADDALEIANSLE